jgi:multidrug efflux system membrane fusion protein
MTGLSWSACKKSFYPGMPVMPAEVPMDKPSAPAAPAAMAEK